MDSHGSNSSSKSYSCYQPSWRNYVNGKLIRYSNKICKCHMRADLRVSESDDNSYMLYYRCAKMEGCGYFRWWVPEKTDFNNGAVFQRGMATVVDQELLDTLRSEVKELKDMVKNSIQPTKGPTAIKIFMILNLVFFMFTCVMYLISSP